MKTMRRAILKLLFIAIAMDLHAQAADAPDPACPICKGLGIVPNLPYKPYVRIDSQPPAPNVTPAWHYCEKCQKGNDAAAIVSEIKGSQARARTRHKETLDATGLKLELVLTPFVALHSNAPPATIKKVADALEKCAGLLLNKSKSMALLTTRPDTDDIYLFNDAKSYETYIDKVTPQSAAMKNGPAYTLPNLAVLKKSPVPDDGFAVFNFGSLLILSATNYTAKPWLHEGFSTYCENKVCGTNAHFHGAIDPKEPNVGNWNDRMRRYAKDGKQKKWDDLLQVEFAGMTQMDSVCCYSAVACLIELDPARFDKLVQNIKDGDDSGIALEKAYGRKIADLQAYWLQWVPKQK